MTTYPRAVTRRTPLPAVAIRWTLIVAALALTAAALVTAVLRVSYPFDIDFVEDGMLYIDLNGPSTEVQGNRTKAAHDRPGEDPDEDRTH